MTAEKLREKAKERAAKWIHAVIGLGGDVKAIQRESEKHLLAFLDLGLEEAKDIQAHSGRCGSDCAGVCYCKAEKIDALRKQLVSNEEGK